jgi:glycosyltransferase involved in cell wall biosynthesis
MKYEPYIEDWESEGWEVTISPFMTMQMFTIAWSRGKLLQKAFWTIFGFAKRIVDLCCVRQYDLVYIYMWVTPFGGIGPEKMVRRLARSVVYDIEDDVLEPPSEPHPLVPKVIAPLMDRTRKVRFLAANADAAIVASPFLIDPLLQLRSGNAFYIPPSLDMDRMCPRPSETAPNSTPVIGWTGTLTGKPYLDIMAEPLRKLSQRRQFKFRTLTNFDYEMPGVDLQVIRWTSEREVEDLQAFDIGVYPLIDDKWSCGKAGLKIIQYQALGIPCVVTDAPLARLQIKDGKTGFLAKHVEDWVNYLEMLIDDNALRKSIGRAGRSDALTRYSRPVIRCKYREVLEKASDS